MSLRALFLAAALGAAALVGGEDAAKTWEERKQEALALAPPKVDGSQDPFREAVGEVFDKPGRSSFVRLTNASHFPARDKEAAEVLLHCLHHASGDVRREAACFLAMTFHDKRTAFLLKDALETEADPRRLAEVLKGISALFETGRLSRARRTSLGFWTGCRDLPRMAWIFAEPPPLPPRRAREAPTPPAFPPDPEVARWVEQLGAVDLEEREAAERKLLEKGAEEPERILSLLPASHDDVEIRERVRTLQRRIPWIGRRGRVLALHRGDPAACRTLEQLLESPGQGAVMGIANLARHGDREKAAQAVALYLDYPDPAIVTAAIRTLGPLGGESGASLLLRFLDDPHAPTRQAAVAALAEAANPSHRDALLPLLADDQGSVRQQALRAIAPIVLREDAPRIASLLSDPSEAVRHDAAEILWRIWGKAAFSQPLGRLATSKDAATALPASHALLAIHGLKAQETDFKAWWEKRKEDPACREPETPPAQGEKK